MLKGHSRRDWAKLTRWTAAGGAGLFLLIQAIPAPRTNPPVDPRRTIEAHLEIAAPVKEILDRSCRDCHSHATEWPWYSYIAPASWLVARDVHKARGIMNFSEWSEEAGMKLEKAVGLLMASCAGVQERRMPKPEYVLLHSRAQLSESDIRKFCAWTQAEGSRLWTMKRKARLETKLSGQQ